MSGSVQYAWRNPSSRYLTAGGWGLGYRVDGTAASSLSFSVVHLRSWRGVLTTANKFSV
jgi:hypothetical protein